MSGVFVSHKVDNIHKGTSDDDIITDTYPNEIFFAR